MSGQRKGGKEWVLGMLAVLALAAALKYLAPKPVDRPPGADAAERLLQRDYTRPFKPGEWVPPGDPMRPVVIPGLTPGDKGK